MADKFVKMSKDGETIEVSPLVVEDHKRLGWKVVAEEQVEESKSSKSEESKKKSSEK